MENKKNFFKDLIVLDIANNHFGDINHSKKIINSFNLDNYLNLFIKVLEKVILNM